MNSFKGYHVGQEYISKVPLLDEDSTTVQRGSRLRIVAIAPKVRMTKADGKYNDGHEYFFNAVRSEEADFWEKYHGTKPDDIKTGRRIRADFCTILK